MWRAKRLQRMQPTCSAGRGSVDDVFRSEVSHVTQDGARVESSPPKSFRAPQRPRAITPFAWWCVLAAVVCASGCMVGPNYAPPQVYTNPQYQLAGNPHLQGQPADPNVWWRYLQDPVLEQQIDTMLQRNLTLKEAGQRVLEARARLIGVQGNLYPQVQQVNGSYARSRLSSTTANFFTFPGIFETNQNPDNWLLNFNASWELDFWGRFRRAIESADASLGVTIAAYDDATVLLLAETANSYVLMRTFERRLIIANQNLQYQRRVLELAKEKKAHGLATAIDVAQAEANYGQTGAMLPTLEAARRQASHRLCVLLGREPIDLSAEMPPTGVIPKPVPQLAFGIPADLLRRRPDVRKAERELAAQSARIGVAESDFYPHISLTGNIGMQSEDLSRLFTSSSTAGLLSPNFSWNILNYGRIRSNVEAEKAAFQRLCFAYRSAVLNAAKDAEDSQVNYVYAFERANWQRIAVNGATIAVDKGVTAYQEGASDYSRIYILQGDLLKLQDQLAATESEIALGLVSIFRSIGGGWESRACQQLAQAGYQPTPLMTPEYVPQPAAPPSGPELVPPGQAQQPPPQQAQAYFPGAPRLIR